MRGCGGSIWQLGRGVRPVFFFVNQRKAKVAAAAQRPDAAAAAAEDPPQPPELAAALAEEPPPPQLLPPQLFHPPPHPPHPPQFPQPHPQVRSLRDGRPVSEERGEAGGRGEVQKRRDGGRGRPKNKMGPSPRRATPPAAHSTPVSGIRRAFTASGVC